LLATLRAIEEKLFAARNQSTALLATASAPPGTVSLCSTLDSDGDGVPDFVGVRLARRLDLGPGAARALDLDSMDSLTCGDVDEDGCDDCSRGGGPDVLNDGPDSDGDGVCDLSDHVPVIRNFTCIAGLLGGHSACSAIFLDEDGFKGHTATIEWGDGTISTCGIEQLADVDTSGGLITCSHSYVVVGSFTPHLAVEDGSPGFNEATASSTLRLHFDAAFVEPYFAARVRRHILSGAELVCDVSLMSISLCMVKFSDPSEEINIVALFWVRGPQGLKPAAHFHVADVFPFFPTLGRWDYAPLHSGPSRFRGVSGGEVPPSICRTRDISTSRLHCICEWDIGPGDGRGPRC
jgi:hypothetical protein